MQSDPPAPARPSSTALTAAEIRLVKTSVLWTCVAFATVGLTVAAFAASETIGTLAVQAVSSVAGTMAPRNDEGMTNVLLLGVGDREHAAADLTDTIIVASLDPGTRSASLISIPRDLYLSATEELPAGKINTLYSVFKRRYRTQKDATASGVSLMALRSVADEIDTRLGIPIQGVVKVDFTGFARIINAVGGIDVVVPHDITDSSYPVEEGRTGTFEIAAGPRHLDGDTALKYARSRHSTSDFDRSARQQQILRAFLEKVRGMGVIPGTEFARSVLDEIRGHSEWTFSMPELIGLGGRALGVQSDNVITMSLNTQTGGDVNEAAAGGIITMAPWNSSGTGSDLVPLSLTDKEDDWRQLRTLAQMMFVHRDLYLTRTSVNIAATAGSALAAHRLRNEFLRYGLIGENTKDNIAPDERSSLQAFGGESEAAAGFFGDLLSLPGTTLPDAGSGARVRIVLGPEYRFRPFETLLENQDMRGR